MRRLPLLCLIGALCINDPGFAADKHPAKASLPGAKRALKPPVREPDGFLRLKLGVALTSQLPQCVSSVYGEAEPKPAFCYANLAQGELGYAQLQQTPDIGVAYSAVVLLWNGNVEDICLVFASDDFPQMVELLVARFGKPNAVEFVNVQGDSGAIFEGAVYKWSGPKVTIQLSEYADKPSESQLVIATNRYLRALQE
jgi:hypothetical protein